MQGKGHQQYSKADKEQIAESFLDIMLHEVFGVPPAIRLDFATNQAAFDPLPADATGSQTKIYWRARERCPTITELVSTIARECPGHPCLRALRFFDTLRVRKGLQGVGDFLLRNVPAEAMPLTRLSLDDGDVQCLLPNVAPDAMARHTRRAFLGLSSLIPAAALVAVAHEAKQRGKTNLYSLLHRPGRLPPEPGVSRNDFMEGRTTVRLPWATSFEEGFTILDLTPSSPVPTFPSIDPEDLGIVVRDRVYRFPAGDEGRKLQSNYAWMHQTVQPIGILATFISASMTALHATQAGYIGLRRRQAAKELVEPFCQAVAGVSDAMDKLAPGSSQTPER